MKVSSASNPSLIRTRIQQLMMHHDCTTYRELGEKLGIDYGYLHHLVSGTKKNPSDRILAKLGLRKVITYERTI